MENRKEKHFEIRMGNRMMGKNGSRGFTILEMLITLTILGILAAGVIPVTRNSIKRQHELELHQALRDIREAIDKYKRFNDSNPGAIPIEERTQSGYPKTLQILVDGFTPAGIIGDQKIRFLRRMPIDPMTGGTDWGLRAFADAPDSDGGSGDDVFDVFSKSEGVALNNTKYKDW
jgi:general secretion pathway protein G